MEIRLGMTMVQETSIPGEHNTYLTDYQHLPIYYYYYSTYTLTVSTCWWRGPMVVSMMWSRVQYSTVQAGREATVSCVCPVSSVVVCWCDSFYEIYGCESCEAQNHAWCAVSTVW